MLTGCRQAGKSTVLSHLLSEKKVRYITLDDIDDRELAKNDPKLFLRKYQYPLIIDEFQRAPELLSQIKIIVDDLKLKSLKDKKIKWQGLFYLTGSRIFETMKDLSESLAGRVTILSLYPLTTREIDGVKEEPFTTESGIIENRNKTKKRSIIRLYDRIIKGGYPELYRVNNLDIQKYYNDYIITYIEKDIRELINVKNESKFTKFMINLAARVSNEINLSDICNDIDISTTTASEWLSILESTHIIYKLKPYYSNEIKRITKRFKLYFVDTGLACFLTKHIYADELSKSMYKGQIFENYVIMEIIKEYTNANQNSKTDFYFLRANEYKEIDLIIYDGKKYYPIEIKSNSIFDKSYIKHFNIFDGKNIKLGDGAVVSLIDKIMPIDENNNIIPVEYV